MPSLVKDSVLQRINKAADTRKSISETLISLLDLLKNIQLLKDGQKTDSKGKTVHVITTVISAIGSLKIVNNRGTITMSKETKQGTIPFALSDLSETFAHLVSKLRDYESQFEDIDEDYSNLKQEFKEKKAIIDKAEHFIANHAKLEEEVLDEKKGLISDRHEVYVMKEEADRNLLSQKAITERMRNAKPFKNTYVFLGVSIVFNILSMFILWRLLDNTDLTIYEVYHLILGTVPN